MYYLILPAPFTLLRSNTYVNYQRPQPADYGLSRHPRLQIGCGGV